MVMKNKIVCVAVLWVLSLCPSVGFAQASRQAGVAVKAPFEFVVGNQTFPAGTYKFRSLRNSVAGKDAIDVLEVRSMESRLYRAIVTDVVGSADEASRPRVRFTRSGGQIFLSEVWEAGTTAGCRLQKGQDREQTAASENDDVTLIASADWH
jgi:hypothetical protein